MAPTSIPVKGCDQQSPAESSGHRQREGREGQRVVIDLGGDERALEHVREPADSVGVFHDPSVHLEVAELHAAAARHGSKQIHPQRLVAEEAAGQRDRVEDGAEVLLLEVAGQQLVQGDEHAHAEHDPGDLPQDRQRDSRELPGPAQQQELQVGVDAGRREGGGEGVAVGEAVAVLEDLAGVRRVIDEVLSEVAGEALPRLEVEVGEVDGRDQDQRDRQREDQDRPRDRKTSLRAADQERSPYPRHRPVARATWQTR